MGAGPVILSYFATLTHLFTTTDITGSLNLPFFVSEVIVLAMVATVAIIVLVVCGFRHW